MATPFDEIFARHAQSSGVPQAIIEATARTESSLNPLAIGDNGKSFGLFQLYEPTARMIGFTGDMEAMLDPETATKWIVVLMKRIIRNQGGIDRLILSNFYSEFNSGKASLWETSEEVFQHVTAFLANYARSISASDGLGLSLLIVSLAILYLYLRGKERR